MRVRHQICWCANYIARSRDEQIARWSNARRVVVDNIETRHSDEITVCAGVTSEGEIKRAAGRATQQLHQRDIRLGLQVLQIEYLKRLQEDRSVRNVAVIPVQDGNHNVFEAGSGGAIGDIRGEERWMFRFRVNANRATRDDALRFREVDDFLQRWNFVQIVVRRVEWARARDAFARAQGLDFGECEIIGPIACNARPIERSGAQAACELGMSEDVGRREFIWHRHGHTIHGRRAKERLVTCDGDAVFGEHEIGLDEIGSHVNRQLIRGERVFGAVAGRAAMADDDGALSLQGWCLCGQGGAVAQREKQRCDAGSQDLQCASILVCEAMSNSGAGHEGS